MAMTALLAAALAHGPDDCPSPAALLPMAQEGGLGARRACLTAYDVTSRFALWCDAAARGQADVVEGDALLLLVGAEDALWMAEHSTGDFSARAARNAIADGSVWADPATRADRSRRLAKLLGVAIELPPPGRPTSGELRACLDVGAAFSHALWGRAYATERDCFARAMLAAEGDATALANLAVLLANAHPDEAARAAILEARPPP